MLILFFRDMSARLWLPLVRRLHLRAVRAHRRPARTYIASSVRCAAIAAQNDPRLQSVLRSYASEAKYAPTSPARQAIITRPGGAFPSPSKPRTSTQGGEVPGATAARRSLRIPFNHARYGRPWERRRVERGLCVFRFIQSDGSLHLMTACFLSPRTKTTVALAISRGYNGPRPRAPAGWLLQKQRPKPSPHFACSQLCAPYDRPHTLAI